MKKKEVVALVGLSASTLWRLVNLGKFPKPIQLSPRRVGWPEYEVENWLANRIQNGTAEKGGDAK